MVRALPYYANLAAEMARAGLSLADLAQESGIAQEELETLLSGESDITLGQMCKIRDVLIGILGPNSLRTSLDGLFRSEKTRLSFL